MESGRIGAYGGRCQGGVVHREASAEGVDGVSDRVQYVGQLSGRELGEASGGGEQVQPLVACVGLIPVESPLFGIGELSGLADLVGELRVGRLVEVEWTPGRLA